MSSANQIDRGQPTEVYLIRHAQSSPSASVHHAEWPLSDIGHPQAESLVDVLAELGLARIFSSPFRRCLDTVGPFVERSGLQLEIRDDLRERLVARTLIDDFVDVWRRSWEDFDFALAGCESSTDAQRRMVAAVRDICETTDAARIGISSHGNVIGLLTNHVDSTCGREYAERLTNPDVVRFLWHDGELRWDPTYTCSALATFATSHAETPVERDPKVATRPATDEDFDQVHRWREQAYRPYVERWFGPWDDPWQRQHLRQHWASRRRAILLVASEPVGVLDVEDSPAILLIGNIIIAPRYRGRGIGTAVLEDLLDEARHKGAVARLKVFRDNPALSLYRRLGFIVSGETEAQLWMEWRP